MSHCPITHTHARTDTHTLFVCVLCVDSKYGERESACFFVMLIPVWVWWWGGPAKHRVAQSTQRLWKIITEECEKWSESERGMRREGGREGYEWKNGKTTTRDGNLICASEVCLCCVSNYNWSGHLSMSACLSCLILLTTDHPLDFILLHTSYCVCIAERRTQGSLVLSVRLFGWAVLVKAATTWVVLFNRWNIGDLLCSWTWMIKHSQRHSQEWPKGRILAVTSAGVWGIWWD